MSERPQFSIVIPTRNRAETLGPAIETCLSQDFEDFELLIVDNASQFGNEGVGREHHRQST